MVLEHGPLKVLSLLSLDDLEGFFFGMLLELFILQKAVFQKSISL